MKSTELSESEPRLGPMLAWALAFAFALAPSVAHAQAVPDPVVQKDAPAPVIPAQSIYPPSLAADSVLPESPPDAVAPARVVLELTIDETGLAKDAKVVSPPQPGFDEAALASVPKLRFHPARMG